MSEKLLFDPGDTRLALDTKYASSNPIARYMMGGYFRTLHTVLDGLNPANILEVGCGDGVPLRSISERFSPDSVWGLDIEEEKLAAARQNVPSASLLKGSAYELPFGDARFDLVLCCEVLEHLEEPERALAEIERAGSEIFVFSVPNEPLWRLLNMARGAYLTSLGNTPGHLRHWSPSAFRAMLEKFFRVERVVKPLPWTMALCRKR